MSLKNIEELTPDEVDLCVAKYVLETNFYTPPKFSTEWTAGGPIIERYLIGSEGKSAWVWYEGRNYGMVGNTQLDACMKALLLSRHPNGVVEVK